VEDEATLHGIAQAKKRTDGFPITNVGNDGVGWIPARDMLKKGVV
jgi:hypothetical protein